jgi:hypothetical protein
VSLVQVACLVRHLEAAVAHEVALGEADAKKFAKVLDNTGKSG